MRLAAENQRTKSRNLPYPRESSCCDGKIKPNRLDAAFRWIFETIEAHLDQDSITAQDIVKTQEDPRAANRTLD